MAEAVHVFIATTSGLVAIQGIAHRQGTSLASFVTVAGGSKVAAITASYRQFVNQNTSPLPQYFDHGSYHMVIGTDINQGESWQLGSAIAHLLYNHDKLGNGHVEPGDTVIIATGEIETISAKIRLITHLAQKCLKAQPQLLKWQAQHCRIKFFVPEENYKQPLPDIAFVLSPVSAMVDVENYLAQQGFIPAHLLIEANQQKQLAKSSLGVSFFENSLSVIGKKLSNFSPPRQLSLKNKGKSKLLKSRQIVQMVLIVTAALVLLWFASSLITGWMQTPAIVYEYEVKTFDSCENRQKMRSTFVFSALTELDSVQLERLCSMYIGFEYFETAPKTVWLVADSYARLSLRQTSDSDEAFSKWRILLPSWQEESRSYFLMAFNDALDESDEQSFEAHLLKMHDSELAINAELLNRWASKQSLPVNLISQTLEK